MNTVNPKKFFIRFTSLVIAALVIGYMVITVSAEKHSDVESTKGFQEEKQQLIVLQDSENQEEVISFSGSLEPADDATIAAKIAGSVTSFSLHAGDEMRRGQLIAEVDHRVLDNELNQAKAEYARAQAEYERQIALRDAATSQAEIGIEEVDVEYSATQVAAIQQLEHAYSNAYDVLSQSLEDNVTALVMLVDQHEFFDKSPNDLFLAIESHVQDERIFVATQLLGADAKSALWNSEFLVELNGGLRGDFETIHRQSIDRDAINRQLDRVIVSLDHTAAGLSYLRKPTLLLQSDQQYAALDAMIGRVNYSINLLTKTRQSIADAHLAVETSANKYTIADKQAQQVLDNTIRQYDTAIIAAKKTVESANQRIATASAMRDQAFVYAPFSGVVTDTYISLGESVLPGTPLVSVAAQNGWKAVFTVSDTYNEMIAVGNPIQIKISGVSGEFQTTISRIIPSLESGSKRVRFEAYLESLPATTRTGMVVSATVADDQSSSETSVLSAARVSTFALPNTYIGYDYDGAYIVTEDYVRMPIVIIDRGVSESRIMGDDLVGGMLLINPHQ